MPPKRKQPPTSTSKPSTIKSKGKEGSHQSSTKPSTPQTFTIPSTPKPILCLLLPPPSPFPTPTTTSLNPTLVFTHGASGGVTNPATLLFAQGFSQHPSSDPTSSSPSILSSVLVFEGNMNLSSRVKMFHSIIESTSPDQQVEQGDEKPLVLGGRSMGARAAVIAMTELLTSNTTHDSSSRLIHGKLVLASYPLVSPQGEVRDAILLAIPAKVSVLFISGDNDSMCPLPRLNSVRRKMKAQSWLITVKGADHGMSLKPKVAVETVRQYIGTAAATWVHGEGIHASKTECVVRWDAHGKKVVDEGWKKGEIAN